MESENTFHLKKKPSAPIPQYVNPGKARKEASRRRAFRSLPRERFLCRLGPFRPPHEIHRRDGSQPTVPCGSFRTGGHVPFCVLQSHSSGVEYIFPTPSLPMEFFILLLVLGLLSGMVFTFVKACQVVSLEQKVRTLETEVSELKERLNSRSSPQRPPAETRKSLPPPVESPVQPIRTLPAAAPVREPACALPSRHSLQPVRNARPAPSRPASFSWEYFIGAKLLSWIGGFVLFLGTGFFVKYSIDNDLISPEWRVTLTYLAAAGLLGAGLSRLRKKYPILSGTLTSTGILVLYLATCAGRMFYELPFFTTAIATVLLAATTAAAFILAVRLRFRIIAFLGIIGGFLTPVILSTGQDHTASLFLYMTILNAGLLAVVAATRWTGAGGTGLAAYTILLMGWFDEYGGPSHILAVVILSICTLLLYGGYGLYAGTRQAEPDRKGGPFLLAFCAIAVTCLTAFRLQAECSFRFLSPSSHLLLLLAGMLPMIALLPLARAKSTYWSCFLPMGLFTIFYFYQSSAEEASQSALWISSQLQGLFCLFMIPASYAVLSARTPSGGAYLAELQPGVRISCFATAALAWLLVMHPLSPSPFYVFLTAATFCGMAAWHRRGQALMAAAAGYTIAASYQDIHPAGSAVIFLAIFLLPLLLVLALVVIVFIVVMTNAERRITIQYAKRVVGRKQMGGQNSYLPLKLNMTGVMPIIFASAMVSIPGTIGSFLQIDQAAHPFWYAFFHTFNYTSLLYIVIYLLLILAFNYFYVAIQYNPVEIANNLRRNNGSIPGFRPGKPTSDFLTRTLNKITLMGAIFLAAVAVLPIILGNLTGMSIQLGGTSLLIVVGVALDTTRSLDSFMTMRNHKGFLG